MKKPILFLCLLVTFVFSNENVKKNRWYTQKQVIVGKELFINNCSVCHGKKAEKTILWKKTLSDGSYPPPPLNGSAHAWHHPKSQLLRIISKGGKLYDGKMPGFDFVLNESDKEAVIAYFQNFWDEEKYGLWLKNGGLTR